MRLRGAHRRPNSNRSTAGWNIARIGRYAEWRDFAESTNPCANAPRHREQAAPKYEGLRKLPRPKIIALTQPGAQPATLRERTPNLTTQRRFVAAAAK